MSISSQWQMTIIYLHTSQKKKYLITDDEGSEFSGRNTDSADTARAVMLHPTDLMNNA